MSALSTGRFFGWLKRLFGGEVDDAEPSSPQKSLAAAILVGLLICGAVAFAIAMRIPALSQPSKGALIKQALKRQAATLNDAISLGDIAIAGQLFAELGPLLRAMNDEPAYDEVPLRYCKLAALHVANGADALYRQIPVWAERRQFEQAIARCE